MTVIKNKVARDLQIIAELRRELGKRTAERDEALERASATADVLKVISRSTLDLQSILGTLVETVARLCDAEMAFILPRDGEVFRAGAAVGFSREYMEFLQFHPISINRGTVTGRVALEGRIVQIADVTADPEYTLTEATALTGQRTALGAPLIHGEEVIGVIVLARRRIGLFTERQIELVSTFADQAVIAIKNARLFEEVQARTRDLEELLQYQTATSDVLKVISRSGFGLNEVFQMLIDSAVRLCADDGVVYLRHGDIFLAEAAFDADAEKIKARNLTPRRPGRGSLTGRVALSGAVEHIPDILADAEFAVAPAQRLKGMRSLLGVPLLREGRVDGVFVLGRREPGHFSERAVELGTTFADQAVIAIENVRLVNQLKAKTADLEEALDQQTATAEVLKVISESVFELQPVFDTMAANAVRLCKAERALIFRFDGNLLRAVASHNVGPELWQFIDRNPIAPGRQSISARAALYRRTVQVIDVQSDPDYSYAARDVDLIRTIVAVPMLKGDQLVGTITIYKLEAKPFTDKQVTLVETFAEQAVIAIENARLFEEVQARTRDLSQSLDDLRTAQDRLVQTEKLASLGQLTAGIAHEIKNPLNFVNNFADLSGELLQELKETAAPVFAALDEKKRAEIVEVIGMLDSNFGKIAEHGRRADGIVKSMLAHSRGGSSECRRVELNKLVEEALNLAYHGARAQDQSFNITLERAFDPDIAPIDLVPQDVTRVLLNLIGNGFYAANKRSREAGSRPVLKVSTRDLGTAVEIRVRDNGIGIAQLHRDKLFQPFFTTKPTGEGTGLGLSISYDIVTQQHGGTIEVDSEPGAFTEFTVRLPRGRHTATGGASER